MISTDVIEQAQRRIGQTLCGKWRLDRVIGVGGMASVYEATHRNKNKVAIKLLHPVLSLEAGTRERFLREGYLANTIDHPGVVRILDDDRTEDGSAFLVMELLRGENVEQRALRQGGILSPREALEIVDQLLDLLTAAHERNVVHRDIKPDNLFWTDDQELKVLDFGIARLSRMGSGATTVGSFMGTPAFSAPEQARGRWDQVDERTDLFAVGATLFTLLSGRHVHEAETSSEQLALAISAPARLLSDVVPEAPPALVRLIDKALQYEKKDRFQSAKAFRAEVQRIALRMPDTPLVGGASDRLSLSARTLPATPSTWFAWGGTFSRLLLGVLAAVGLALVLLWIGPAGERVTTEGPEPAKKKEPGGDLHAAPAVPMKEDPEVGESTLAPAAEQGRESPTVLVRTGERSSEPSISVPDVDAVTPAPLPSASGGAEPSSTSQDRVAGSRKQSAARTRPTTSPSGGAGLFDKRY